MRERGTPIARPKGSFWRCERGAAMTEGVIVLPFFIIIFAGSLYLFTGHRHKSRLKSTARRVALDEAIRGCPNADAPDEWLLDGLDTNNFSLEARKNVPVIGQEFIKEIVTETRTEVREGEVRRPGVFGGDQTLVRAGYAIECNEIPRNSEGRNDIAVLDTFCTYAQYGENGTRCEDFIDNYDCNECTIGESYCVDKNTEVKCLDFESCGLWSRELPCGGGDKTCFAGSCQDCDTDLADDAGMDLPPCPEALPDAGP